MGRLLAEAFPGDADSMLEAIKGALVSARAHLQEIEALVGQLNLRTKRKAKRH